MSKESAEDPKEKFRKALERKNRQLRTGQDGVGENSKLQLSQGKKARMFRRKSG